METLIYLTQELEKNRVSVQRLKQLLFGVTTEKTQEVMGKIPDEADTESNSGDDAAESKDTEARQKAKGHGRNGAGAYTDTGLTKGGRSEATAGNRKIGLGVMGFADMLVLLGVRYDSDEAVEWARKVARFVQKQAHQASEDLAKERGCFPHWKGSIWDTEYHRPVRHASVTTIAPTGSISIIAGCNRGIESIFKLSQIRRTPMWRISQSHDRAAEGYTLSFHYCGPKDRQRYRRVVVPGRHCPCLKRCVTGKFVICGNS
jgi:hypothetical protein